MRKHSRSGPSVRRGQGTRTQSEEGIQGRCCSWLKGHGPQRNGSWQGWQGPPGALSAELGPVPGCQDRKAIAPSFPPHMEGRAGLCGGRWKTAIRSSAAALERPRLPSDTPCKSPLGDSADPRPHRISLYHFVVRSHEPLLHPATTRIINLPPALVQNRRPRPPPHDAPLCAATPTCSQRPITASADASQPNNPTTQPPNPLPPVAASLFNQPDPDDRWQTTSSNQTTLPPVSNPAIISTHPIVKPSR